MNAPASGDRVALINEGSTFTDTGNLIARGETGTVIGHKGFNEVVVSWTSGVGVASITVVRVVQTRG